MSLFLSLFNDGLLGTVAVYHYDSEWWIWKDMDIRGRSVFWATDLVLAWRDWRKPRKHQPG